MNAERRAEMQMDVLEAKADAWAGRVGLTLMIGDATSPMLLDRAAPAEVVAAFHERMKSQVFAIAQQAFMEGVIEGVALVNAELRQAEIGGGA